MNRILANLIAKTLDRGKAQPEPGPVAPPPATPSPAAARRAAAARTPKTASAMDPLDGHFDDARALVDAGRGRHAVDTQTRLMERVPAAISPAPPPAAAPGVPVVDVALIERVLTHVTTNPKKLDQRTWWEYGDDLASECGTVGCFAGWTVALGRPDLIVDEFGIHRVIEAPGERLPLMHVRQTARHLLGLPQGAAEAMFNPTNKLRDLWELAEFFTLGAVTVPAELPDGS